MDNDMEDDMVQSKTLVIEGTDTVLQGFYELYGPHTIELTPTFNGLHGYIYEGGADGDPEREPFYVMSLVHVSTGGRFALEKGPGYVERVPLRPENEREAIEKAMEALRGIHPTQRGKAGE